MAKGRSGTIPDEVWERHKAEIASLYRGSTLERAMQLMSQRHGFQASKNQYTSMLKRWGIRKYSSAQDWKKIDSCIRKRQLKGKDTNAVLNGNLISQDKLEKKILRHISFTDRIFEVNDDDNISIPDGFTILTPPADMVLPSNNRVIPTNNLPWFLFNQVVRSNSFLWKTFSDSTMSMTGQYFDVSAHSLHYPILESLEASHIQPSLGPNSIYPSPSGIENFILNIESISNPSPDFGSSWVTASSNLVLMNTEIPASLTVLLQKTTTKYLDTTIESIYKTYMVEETQIESNMTLNMNTYSNPTAYRLFSLFVYMTTNNLLPTRSVQEIYDWMYSNSCTWIFTEILKLKSKTIDVFATKLLPAAVQVGDGEMVRNLVVRNVDIDTPVEKWAGRDIRTALSLAVGKRNLDMIKLLCKLGATPRILEIDSVAYSSERNVSLWSHDSIQILQLLLNNGADPDGIISNCQRGYPLIQAASEGSLGAVSLLIAAKANVNLVISEQWGTALQAAAMGGHDLVVRALLEAGADTNMACIFTNEYDDYGSQSERYNKFRTPIQIAARANNVEITKLLLQSKALVNFCPILTTTSLEWIDAKFALSEECQGSTDEILPFAFAIQYAAQNANIPLVQHLLAAGALVDSRIGVDYGSTPLQLAARSGNVELVSLLLARNADVNAPPGRYNGRTAIQAAAESGNNKVIQMLLDAHANINASPGWRGGRTALQAALEKGHINAARRLLLAGAYINANHGFSGGLTALQAAVSFGDIDIVKEILDYQADINAAAGSEYGFTALQIAINHKNIDLLELLLQAGADVDALPSELPNKTALQCAVYDRWKEGVQILLKYHPDVRMLPPYQDDLKALSALGWAIYNRDHDMMVILLDHGAGPNDPVMNSPYPSPTSFVYALSESDFHESIRLLLGRGADIFQSWDSETALDVAIETAYKNFEVVRMIIDLIQQTTTTTTTTTTRNYFDASLRNSLTRITVDYELPADIELLKILLDAGADINAKGVYDKATILQKSATYGSLEVIEFLLQHGAEVSVPATRDIGTPLQEAIKNRQIEIANLLLEHGADVNATPAEDRGVTALQAVAIRGYVPLALKLLERGADVIAAPAPIDGRTAIDGAAEHGHLDMLQLLLNAYSDREGLATVCNQAAGFAEREGHAAIATWLRTYNPT